MQTEPGGEFWGWVRRTVGVQARTGTGAPVRLRLGSAPADKASGKLHRLERNGRCVVMELSAQAGPGVEKTAEQAVESACHLADLAAPNGWSTAPAEDVLDAIDILAS
ncbi:hypothetical protein ABZ192_42855 [Streptomyces sp. NPDC006235]|uniref:hypothetical protein n=1 Tax=Streptomyces sp. NPDC006235 TaxID=3156736 RepID=UPI0033BACC9F